MEVWWPLCIIEINQTRSICRARIGKSIDSNPIQFTMRSIKQQYNGILPRSLCVNQSPLTHLIQINMNRTPYCRHSIVYIWAILASICSLNTGWDIGIIATAIIYIQKDLGLNDSQIQYMVASTNFFAIFGSIIGGQCAHKFGRKKVIISTAIASFCAVLLMAPTSNFGVILLCRSIFGLCAGSAVVVTSMVSILLFTVHILARLAAEYYHQSLFQLIAEISPADIRGKMVSFSPVLRNIAHVLGYTMALSLHYYGVNDSMAWRVMVYNAFDFCALCWSQWLGVICRSDQAPSSPSFWRLLCCLCPRVQGGCVRMGLHLKHDPFWKRHAIQRKQRTKRYKKWWRQMKHQILRSDGNKLFFRAVSSRMPHCEQHCRFLLP